MKTAFLSGIIFMSLMFYNIPSSYSQEEKTCKGYIIVQETYVPKIGMTLTDTVFLTKNYCFRKGAQSISSPTMATFEDYKNNLTYMIIYSPSNLSQESGKTALGIDKYVSKFQPEKTGKCIDSIVYLNEQKKINGFETRKILIIAQKESSLEKKGDTTVAFVAKDIDLRPGLCPPGFILESENAVRKIKTVTIKEKMLPEDMSFVLMGAKNMEDINNLIDFDLIFFDEIEIQKRIKELFEK